MISKKGLNVLKFNAYKNKVTNDIIYTMLVTCKGKTFAFDGFYNFNIQVINELGTKI